MSEIGEEDLSVVLNHAYFYLKFRLRSRKEMQDYLGRKAEKYHWPLSVVEAGLKKLEQLGLLNDHEFTRAFVESRRARRPKSDFVLRRELLRFGITEETIGQYLSEHPSDEEALAALALSRKWPQYGDLNKQKRFARAAAFLTRRGFSFDIIKKVIAKNQEEE
ncbi:RecX family transcriptional regulator [Candidatus Roizmanbacteria bacterium]|nr:RecX family transcriptional regulator [Candidatus Roizmanbacteria bacterium]